MKDLKSQIQSVVNIYKTGNLEKAELLTRNLISKNSNIVFLYNLLGLILSEQNKVNEAIQCYEKGMEVDPNFAMIYNNLALLYVHKYSDLKKAEKFYKKSISLDESIAEPHNNLGSLYKSLDEYNKAINCYKKAISINSNFVQAYHNLGNVYVLLGNFDDAKKNLIEGLKINPMFGNSHRTLSRIIKYKKNDKHLAQLEDAYKKIGNKNLDDKVHIGFALGKAYEDIGNYDESFKCYNESNSLYEKKTNFSMNVEKEKFNKIKEAFNKETMKKYFECGSNNNSIIFIVGMPRSGTTLVEQILSSHPKVFGADEQAIITKLAIKNFYNKDLSLFFSNILNFTNDSFKKIGEEYLEQINKISNNSDRVTDKMPENFLWIGFIKLILPNSKIIHCFRNPKDNCLSLFKNHFPSGRLNYTYNFNKIVQYYNLYSELMHYWKDLIPNFIYDLEYEKLVSNENNEIKNLLNFCELEWNQKCINFYENKRVVKTASDVQARKKIYSSSVNLWEKYKHHLDEYFKKLTN